MPLDYTGADGGRLALAFAAGWALATSMWFAIAASIWKLFLEPRIKAMEADRADDKRRIEQLETILMLHPPQAAAARTQAVVSELRGEMTGKSPL